MLLFLEQHVLSYFYLVYQIFCSLGLPGAGVVATFSGEMSSFIFCHDAVRTQMIPHDLSRGAELQPQYFEEGNNKPDPSWGRKSWFISPWQSRLPFLWCICGCVTSLSPRLGLLWAPKMSEGDRTFPLQDPQEIWGCNFEGTRSLKGPKGREAGLAAAFAVVADLNSVESNRSVFVTNAQNFQAWCINNGIFSFQPQWLNSVGFSDPSQLKGYLFKFNVEIWITINTQKK